MVCYNPLSNFALCCKKKKLLTWLKFKKLVLLIEVFKYFYQLIRYTSLEEHTQVSYFSKYIKS